MSTKKNFKKKEKAAIEQPTTTNQILTEEPGMEEQGMEIENYGGILDQSGISYIPFTGGGALERTRVADVTMGGVENMFTPGGIRAKKEYSEAFYKEGVFGDKIEPENKNYTTSKTIGTPKTLKALVQYVAESGRIINFHPKFNVLSLDRYFKMASGTTPQQKMDHVIGVLMGLGYITLQKVLDSNYTIKPSAGKVGYQNVEQYLDEANNYGLASFGKVANNDKYKRTGEIKEIMEQLNGVIQTAEKNPTYWNVKLDSIKNSWDAWIDPLVTIRKELEYDVDRKDIFSSNKHSNANLESGGQLEPDSKVIPLTYKVGNLEVQNTEDKFVAIPPCVAMNINIDGQGKIPKFELWVVRHIPYEYFDLNYTPYNVWKDFLATCPPKTSVLFEQAFSKDDKYKTRLTSFIDSFKDNENFKIFEPLYVSQKYDLKKEFVSVATRIRVFSKYKNFVKFSIKPTYNFYTPVIKLYPKMVRDFQKLVNSFSKVNDNHFSEIMFKANKPSTKEHGAQIVYDALSPDHFNPDTMKLISGLLFGFSTKDPPKIPICGGYFLKYPSEPQVVFRVTASVPKESTKQSSVFKVTMHWWICRQLAAWFYGKKKQLEKASNDRINQFLQRDTKDVNALRYFVGTGINSKTNK